MEREEVFQKVAPYIKSEKMADFQTVYDVNSESGLGRAMMRMVVDMILAVGSGMSFDEMDKEICCKKHGTSGFAMGWAVNLLSQVTTFGDDIRKWWNRQWGIGDEETRTINPCIIGFNNDDNGHKM
jgi:hypothetical protein